jgi:hypothetical protein
VASRSQKVLRTETQLGKRTVGRCVKVKYYDGFGKEVTDYVTGLEARVKWLERQLAPPKPEVVEVPIPENPPLENLEKEKVAEEEPTTIVKVTVPKAKPQGKKRSMKKTETSK